MSSTAGAIERTRDASGGFAIQRQLVVVSMWMILGLLVALAVLLLARRVGGAFQQPLGGATIVMIAIVAELTSVGWRRLALGNQYSVPGTQYIVPRLLLIGPLPTLSVFTFFVALTIPETPVWALILAWLTVVAGEAAQWRYYFRPKLNRFHLRPPTPVSPPLAADVEATEDEIPPGLIQQVTRVIEDNRESIHALVKAHVAPNDRLAIIHLAFCPPLTERPELTAHAIDMDDAEVRVTQAETFGARIEARLTTVAATERAFLIEVLGSVTAAKSA